MAYFVTAALTLASALLPHVWNRLVTYRWSSVIGDLVSAVIWTFAFCATAFLANASGWKRWWLAFTAPLALFPALRTISAFLVWKSWGFAP